MLFIFNGKNDGKSAGCVFISGIKNYDLPDLSAWVVGCDGENGDAYTTDFNPQAERDASLLVN